MGKNTKNMNMFFRKNNEKKRTKKTLVDGHFGSPTGREKPNNTDRKELANG